MNVKVRIIRQFSFLTGARYTSYMLRFVADLFAAKSLGPVQYGVYQYLSLFRSWGNLLCIAYRAVVSRNMPILFGKGNSDTEIKEISSTCYSLDALISCSYYCLILLWCIIKKGEYLIYMLIIIGTNAIMLWGNFYSIEVQSRKKLEYIGFVMVATGSLTCAGVMVFVYYLQGGITTYLLVNLFITPIGAYLYKIKAILGFNWSINWKKVLAYTKIAIPLHLMTLGFWGMRLADRTIIVTFLDIEDLGQFSFALLVSDAMFKLVYSVNQTFRPYFFERYGQVGDVKGMKRYVKLPFFMMSLGMPMVCSTAYLIYPIFVRTFYPQYLDSVKPFQIMAYSSFFLAISSVWVSVLNIKGKFVTMVVNLSVILAINITLSIFLIQYGLGIRGVAFGSITSWSFYPILSYITSKGWKILSPVKYTAMVMPGLILTILSLVFTLRS